MKKTYVSINYINGAQRKHTVDDLVFGDSAILMTEGTKGVLVPMMHIASIDFEENVEVQNEAPTGQPEDKENQT